MNEQLFAHATCALIEALGLMSENMQRQAVGNSMAYREEAFTALIQKHGLDDLPHADEAWLLKRILSQSGT